MKKGKYQVADHETGVKSRFDAALAGGSPAEILSVATAAQEVGLYLA